MSVETLTMPSVESMPTAVPAKPKRLTFEQAIQQVYDDGHVAQLLRSDKPYQKNQLRWARSKDLSTFKDLVRKLQADLSKITGIECVARNTADNFNIHNWSSTNPRSSKDALPSQVFQIYERRIHSRFSVNKDGVQQSAAEYDRLGFRLPMVAIEKYDDDSLGVTYHTPGGSTYKATLKNCAYKSTDDFTRRIPSWIQKKIDLLETTHFDYRPKILDGFLVKENLLASPLQKFKTNVKEFVEAVQDPALAISIGEHHYALDYWKEPFQYATTRKLQTLFSFQRLMAAFFIAGLIVSFVGAASCIPGVFQNKLTSGLGLLTFAISTFSSSVACIAAMTKRTFLF